MEFDPYTWLFLAPAKSCCTTEAKLSNVEQIFRIPSPHIIHNQFIHCYFYVDEFFSREAAVFPASRRVLCLKLKGTI